MGGHVSHIKYHSIYQIYNNHYLLATPTINTNWNLTTTTKKTKTPLLPSIFIHIFIVIGIGLEILRIVDVIY